MKLKLGLLIILLAATAARAQTNDLTALLQQGLFEEQANRNLDAAIANYQMLAAQFEKDRQLAATAVFRLGECYRAEGKTNEAAAQYQRILSDFADQTILATLSRQDLTGMGMEKRQPQFGAPSKSPEQQAIELEEQRTGAGTNFTSPGEASDPQDQEIQRIKLLIQNSPDLINASGNGSEYPPLILAARSDSLRVARYLLDNQANVNVTDNQGETALTTAAAGGHRAIAELLLSRGAEINAKDVNGNTALHQAAKYGFQAVIETLLANHADVNAPDLSGTTPLFLAAANGKLKNVQLLLDAGANPYLRDSGGRTALNYAIGTSAEIMQALLKAGTIPNTTDSQHRTPLSYAVERGSPEIVKILLAGKADPNLCTLDTPLLCAINKKDATSAKLLLENGAWPNVKDPIDWSISFGRSYYPQGTSITPLFYAILTKQPLMVQLLLKYKADPNDSQTDGQSLLFGALSDADMLAALLTAGANPNVVNNEGRTPLSFAARDSPEMVKMLLDAKADPNGGRLDAPLLSAVENQNAVSAELLLQAGAYPNTKGEVNWVVTLTRNDVTSTYRPLSITPLCLAVSMKQLPMVKLLLKFKADPSDSQIEGWALLFSALTDTNILDAVLGAGANVDPVSPEEHQWTPLAAAAGQNYSASVGILLKHGANPNLSNRNGMTPLHWAAYRLADETVLRLLLDYKADPNVRNGDRNTPLDELKKKLAANDVSQEQKTLAVRLADLLRQHGALDALPDWDRITVSRPSAHYSMAMFYQGTNDWNHFTLFDLLGAQYDLLTASPRGAMRVQTVPYGYSANDNWLSFPDLTRIVIHRPSATGTNWNKLKINLARALNSGDCSSDVPLRFGDVVEIPEADHVINERWTGLSTNELFTLKSCLTRHLQITVNGQTTNINVAPQVWELIPGSSEYPLSSLGAKMPPEVGLFTAEPFMLWPFLANSKLLLSSSDLSRVVVKRRDIATGKLHEWTVDCSQPGQPPNFWLRDGDVIEVPEKQ